MVRTVTFQPGTTEVLYGISIVNDDNNESPETFTASLSTTDPNVNIIDGGATVTIIDDEGMLFSIIKRSCMEVCSCLITICEHIYHGAVVRLYIKFAFNEVSYGFKIETCIIEQLNFPKTTIVCIICKCSYNLPFYLFYLHGF